jgi:hypothetical protein
MLIFARPKYVVTAEKTGSTPSQSEWTDQAFLTDEFESKDGKIMDQKVQELKDQEKIQEAMSMNSDAGLQAKRISAADDLKRKISGMKEEYYKLTHQKDQDAAFSQKVADIKKKIADAETDEEKKQWTETLLTFEREQQDEKNQAMDMIKKYKSTIYLYEQKLKEIEQAEKSGQGKKS